MSATAAPLMSAGAFLAIFGGALGGVWLARRLPKPHLGAESRTAISVSMAVVGTLSALVLSLLISNASTAFNARSAAVEALAVALVRLNHALVQIGSQADGIDRKLQAYASAKMQELSRTGEASEADGRTLPMLEELGDALLDLRPAQPREQQIQVRALRLLDAMTEARWTLAAAEGTTIPYAFLVILIFWLTLLFASFGLFAPSNETVMVALFLCATAIAGGIYVILELGSPDSGFIRVSTAPLETAVREIGATAGRPASGAVRGGS